MAKMKKLPIICMVFVLAVASVSCGRIPPGVVDEKDIAGKTLLRVASYGGGYGSEWLEAVKKRFEEEYKDKSFEEGKTGVYVEIDDAKNNGVTLLASNVTTLSTHVFFNELIDYDQFIAQGYALDLTDVIKEKLPGEDKSIYDKFSPEQKTYLERTGKYYMVPHYAGFNGITIDEDLFNEKRLFLGTDGRFNHRSTDQNLSAGPDKKAGTYDDGLPATLDEFYALMDSMVSKSVVPFVWSADNQFYATRMAEAFAADVNGAANTTVGYSFSGTLDNLVKSVSGGNVTLESAEITNANGYEIVRQEGYYYSLELLEKIVDNTDYHHPRYCFDGGTQLEAQRRFLQSNSPLAASSGENPIGMLIDGCWWEGEATATFEAMEKQNTPDRKYGKKDRNFRFIPFPKATAEKVGESVTLLETLRAYGFVNANLANNANMKRLATLFLQYCNTDVSLREFTYITSATKALEYDMDAESLAKCTTLCKSILDMKNAEGSKMVYPLSDNLMFRTTVLQHTNGLRYTTNKGGDPTTVFHNDRSYTALDCFNGMYTYLSRDWASKYGQYIN